MYSVVDDENIDRVTVDSLVTLTVTLKRSSLLEAGLMRLDDTNVLDSVVDGDEVQYVQGIGCEHFMSMCSATSVMSSSKNIAILTNLTGVFLRPIILLH